MRRKLRVPQIAAVMGPCIAGGAYLPALSDVIIMVEGTSFMGLGGPNLVKGATGQVIDAESLGGARLHTAVSGVAHYMAKDDADCLEHDPRALPRRLPRAAPAPQRQRRRAQPAEGLYGVLPADHRLPYDIEDVIVAHLRSRRLPRISARVRAGDAVRQCAPGRASGGHHRQPPRISESRRTAAHRRHRLHGIGAQGGVLRRNRRTRWASR